MPGTDLLNINVGLIAVSSSSLSNKSLVVKYSSRKFVSIESAAFVRRLHDFSLPALQA